MISVPGRARRLAAAGGLTAAAWFAAWDLYLWFVKFTTDPYDSDVRALWIGARIGLDRGWWRIYDDSLQRAYAVVLDPSRRPGDLPIFGGPPPDAWLAIPLTAMPFLGAYLAVAAVNLGFLVAAWLLLVSGSWWRRAGLGLAALACFPVAHGLQIGNPAVWVSASLGVSYALIEREREWLGGVFLVPLVLDPNLGVLLPAAYLLVGRWRPVLVLLCVGGVLALASAASLGPGGLRQYFAMLELQSTLPFNRYLGMASLGSSPLTIGLEAAIAVAALAVAARARRLDVAFITGSVASLLVTPYIHLHDLTVAVMAAWVYMRTEAPPAHKLWLLPVAVAAEFVWVVGPLPMLAALVGWLGLMALLPGRQRVAAA